ncbi:hypothetical protein GCM10017643_43820 [Ancylobacter dichloromethanicus]|uniref:Uncharacterized protein n=1 Tax=Ancylobacter dichloromethanicus TaxID=518825 RepID=A0A9W6JE01_9HYPH|nr:hypothetical protein GCM10017643_43820 [Ancylobacter dichloromethanicus]
MAPPKRRGLHRLHITPRIPSPEPERSKPRGPGSWDGDKLIEHLDHGDELDVPTSVPGTRFKQSGAPSQLVSFVSASR